MKLKKVNLNLEGIIRDEHGNKLEGKAIGSPVTITEKNDSNIKHLIDSLAPTHADAYSLSNSGYINISELNEKDYDIQSVQYFKLNKEGSNPLMEIRKRSYND
ncbi:MAG: hypothetical protein ACOCRX_02120 [Candidatus Woesearchaeota archaeon]